MRDKMPGIPCSRSRSKFNPATIVIQIPDDQAAAPKARAAAHGLTLAAWFAKLAEQETPAGPPLKPCKTGRGTLAKYGPAPSAEQIDQNRKDMFRGFAQEFWRLPASRTHSERPVRPRVRPVPAFARPRVRPSPRSPPRVRPHSLRQFSRLTESPINASVPFRSVHCGDFCGDRTPRIG
jgi:hypothetical protein